MKGEVGLNNVRPFLKAFILILICTTFIAFFSFISGKAVETIFPTPISIPEGTFIGSVPVSGLTSEEAEEKLETEIEKWKNNTTFKLVFFDEFVQIPATNIQFFINESLQLNEQGHGDILNTISDTTIKEAVEQLSYYIPKEKVHIEGIQEVMQFHAANLSSTPLYINVNEYLKDQYEIELVAQSVITNFESTLLLDEWAKNLNGTVIEARDSFSLLEALEKSGSVLMEVESLNVLATALYDTFLQTNFQINERHAGSYLREFADLGFQAIVKPNSLNLIVENQNYYPYTLLILYEENQLKVSLEGVSFPSSYSAVTKNERIIDPRKIVHFSNELRNGDRQIVESGKNGYFVEVFHQKRARDMNELINEQLISEDFYPPIHNVEIRSLQERTSGERRDDEDEEDRSTLPDEEPRKEDDEGEASETDDELKEDDSVEDEEDLEEEPIEEQKGY